MGIFDVGAGFELAGSSGSDRNIIRNLKVAYARSSPSTTRSLSIPGTSDYNRIYDLRIANHTSSSGNKALEIAGQGNLVSRANISNVKGEALSLSGTAQKNIVTQLIATHTTDAGVYLSGAVSSNIVMNLTTVNNTYNGIYFASGVYNKNHFVSSVIANVDKGIQANSGTTGSENVFRDLYIANYGSYSAEFSSGFNGISSAGYFLDGSVGCAAGGFDLCSAGAWYSNGGDLTNAFIGEIGESSSVLSTLAAWLHLDSWARSWGKSGPFPESSLRGIATSDFQVWDWRPKDGQVLHNRSYGGTSPNGPLNLSGMSCASQTVSPTDYIDMTDGLGLKILRNAIEIDGDGRGNDNSLCESGEDCVWSPHIGAYQGEGPLSEGYCTVDDGADPGLDGIRVFTYQSPI
ncbi:MAG: hypothetical protein HC902_10825 [Calothrix sp. SM1_5_4]|nr:hypothetical protein [Calothrix sp. SM1_5_4]